MLGSAAHSPCTESPAQNEQSAGSPSTGSGAHRSLQGTRWQEHQNKIYEIGNKKKTKNTVTCISALWVFFKVTQRNRKTIKRREFNKHINQSENNRTTIRQRSNVNTSNDIKSARTQISNKWSLILCLREIWLLLHTQTFRNTHSATDSPLYDLSVLFCLHGCSLTPPTFAWPLTFAPSPQEKGPALGCTFA